MQSIPFFYFLKMIFNFLKNLCPKIVTLHYKSRNMKITFLGTGTSGGVPTIACHCDVCDSTDPHDKRFRSSVWIQTKGKSLLIDVGPDFRSQALINKIEHLDCALITHFHKDHLAGLDDLKQFYLMNNEPFPIFSNKSTLDNIHIDFSYTFQKNHITGIPKFSLHNVQERAFMYKDIEIQPIPILHHQLSILGFRIGKFAYITDGKTIPETSYKFLRNLDVLVINALRKTPHFSHFSLQEALEQIDIIQPKVAYLTHISHQLGKHNEVSKTLPNNVFLAFDQLTLEI